MDLDYFFDYIYELYFVYRDEIRNSKSFLKFLEDNKDEKDIYLIILSDLQNQID